MSEFRIHHDVNELLSLLRVHGGEGAEVYIDLLQKNRTPYVTTTVSAHSAKVKIAEFSRTPEDFLKKYDELKSKNTRNLDPLVYLLSKLTEDKETLQYLQQNARERAELAAAAAASSSTSLSAPAPAARISLQELEELRKQLGSVAAGSTWQQAHCPWPPRRRPSWKTCSTCWRVWTAGTSPPSRSPGDRAGPSWWTPTWTCPSGSW
ncbi:tubulin gamma complex associated protein 2 [Phyllostomus discolor]|uniref:Tubulin gamma complex associated protein 2 n=1 Tax=Phyllostomus discolor TaxID=89673 RepID=A0A834EF74_9CHIR|nr:tubulin gamma complex associated protein 2 [Phyllostomus discolor]